MATVASKSAFVAPILIATANPWIISSTPYPRPVSYTHLDVYKRQVFVGGQAYGLRSRAGNFTMDELREGIEYAHARGVDVHVASNMVTHEGRCV